MSAESNTGAAVERNAGSQQGDYSRSPLEPAKHYSAVRMQQGRVLLDADWNAEIDLLAQRRSIETRDTLGQGAAPAGEAGFGIETEATLSFEGRGHHVLLEAPDWTALVGAEGFTLEMRLNPRSSGMASALVNVVSRREVEGFALELDEQVRLVLKRPGCSPLVSPERLALGRFGTAALALSAGGATLFANGRPVASDNQTCRLPEGPAKLVFGAALPRNPALPGFDGELQELCLWRGRRETVSMRTDVEKLVDPRAEGLVGAWAFTTPSSAVPDRGGHGLELKLGSEPGSAPAWRLRQVFVGRGRYYLDGLLCENEATRPFVLQLDAPGSRLPVFSLDRLYVFYLDAWELLVTDIQDPGLAEVALGGADTTVRTRTVAQVKVLSLPAEEAEAPGELPRLWRRFAERAQASGRLRARRAASPVLLGNLLYRVEIHTQGGVHGWPRRLGEDEVVLSAAPLEGGGEGVTRVRVADWPEGEDGWQVGDRVELWSESTDQQGQAGPTASLSRLDSLGRTLDLEGLVGSLPEGRGLRLRRVATFKWSRQNASVVYAVAELEGGSQVVTLADPGRRALELEPGDWIEYLDDDTLVGTAPGTLARVEALDPAMLTVTLNRPLLPASGHPGGHPAVRRWDQKAAEDSPFGVILAAPGWLPIEDGIEVFFEGDGPYRGRDFWWLPARTATENIDWPELREAGQAVPAPLGPRGIAHHLAPLAVLGFQPGSFTLRDLRKTFRPISDGAVSKAGDSMYGPLVIRSHLVVEGGGPSDPGTVTAETYYGVLGTPDSVTTPNLAAGAVTAPKLAPDVGVVPPSYAILGPTPEPPPGYDFTGSALTVFQPTALWSERAPFPRADPGPLRGAALAGRLFVALESGELWEYDPALDRWRSRCRRPGELQGFAVAAAAGKLFVVGGVDALRGKSAATLVYDPALDRWAQGGEMPTPRSHLSLAAVGGRLYAVGGLERSWLGERASRRNEEYDPASGRWSRRAPLPHRAYDLGLGAAAGSLHAFGGVGRPWFGLWGRSMTNAHHLYQPSLDHWRRHQAPLPHPLAHPGVAEVEDRLFVLGGEGALGALDLVLELDPAVSAWNRRPPVSHAASWVASGAVAGRLVATLGAASCATPPTTELPAAMRYFIHRKEG